MTVHHADGADQVEVEDSGEELSATCKPSEEAPPGPVRMTPRRPSASQRL